MKYTFGQFADLVGGKIHENFDREKTINIALSDSRKIQGEGNLFIALRGDRFDGHSFVEEITSNGKNIALVEDENFLYKNTVCVPDVRKAMYDFALQHREKVIFDKKCVAVTGSVGKTSTKEFVSAVFSSQYNVYKSPGNHNSYTGLPMVLFNCSDDAEYMVLEAGMNMPGEIQKISNLIKPDVAVITNIGWSHSENLGGRDNIFKEKLDITSGMNEGVLVVNGDDDYLSKDLPCNCHVVRCSFENKKADYYCNNIEYIDDKLFFEINGKKAYIYQEGIHNVKNALLAYAAGICGGVDEETAREAITKVAKKESRIKVKTGKNGCVVIEDCYNAAPESMKAALDYLKCKEGKKIAVLGDMLELGEYSKELHEGVGQYAFGRCDVLICYGELGAYIAKGGKKAGIKEVYHFEEKNRDAFIDAVRQYGMSEHNILFKASNRMRFGEIINLSDIL